MKRKLLLVLSMVFVMTTMLVCAVGCKKEDAHKHTWSTEWSADGEMHWHACTGDGCTAKKDEGNHEGGKATCTEKATCSVCGAKYGELDATNHASSAFTYVSNGDGTHTKKYACCNVAAEEPENCAGGTATCTEKATCSLCNAKYGELDATNHTETTYKYEANNDGTHKKIHTCCNAVEVADEACSGGAATVCGEKNVCERCNAEYGDPLAHEWKTEYVFGNNQHWHECSRTGCTATSEKENCSGGTATCIEKATCATCHNKYGELNAANHTETTYKYEANNNGTHKKIHTCCNAVEVAAEACSGGTATCTEKATCSHCNAKYGDTIAHTEVIDAALAATCTEKGKTEGKHCSVCNTVLVAQTEIPANGHTEVVDAAVAATCTEKGKTEGKHCSVCNTVLVAQTEVAALGHDYAAAWAKDGEKHWHECTRCHDKKDIAAHKVSTWKVGDTEDTALCECGEELDETFVKTVTAKRQDLVVTTYTNASLDKNTDGWYTYTETYNTNASIVLTGVTYESIVCVKFGDAVLGNALTGLNLSALTDFTKHGEQNFTVIVKDKYDLEHTITVPVLLVTREISTATEMMILGNSKNYGTNVTISGYYRLKNDLISGMREYTQSWVTFNRAVFDGNNHKIKLGHYYHYAPGNGLFKNINGSTIKNLTIDTDYLNKGTAHVVLASEAFGGSVFENITINYIDSVDTNPNNATYNQDFATDTCNTQGFLFASNVASCTFKNFTINANHKKIGVLLGRANAWGNGTLDSCKFENFKVLNCSGMGALAWKGQSSDKYMPGDVEGITVDILENATLSAQDIILADKDGEKTEFALNLGDYDGTILGVTFGASALTVQGKAINIPDAMKNGKHGANTLYVTTQKADGKKYYITVPVTIVTEEITTLERLTACITYKTNTNNEKWQDGKYFTLGGDISMTNYSLGGVTNGNWSGFAGVFDGRGHNLVGGTMGNAGLFGSIHCGTVKNVNFTEVKGGTNPHRTLVSHTLFKAVFENVNITIVDKADFTPKMTADGKYTRFNGLFAVGHCWGVTMKDVKVDATDCKFNWLFGKGYTNVAQPFACENVEVKLGFLECLVANSNDAQVLTEIPGITVIYTHTHTYTEHEATAATYYEEGMKAYYTCECGKKFVKNGEEYVEVTDESTLVIAKKKLADDVKGEATVEDIAAGDLIKDIVYLEKEGDPTSNKVKVFDQTAPNYVKTTKDGKEVVALYFTKATALTADQDSSNNYGNSEFRITVTGNIAKLSFDYRLVDSNTEKCLTLGEGDKGYGMKSFLEYKHGSGAYDNVTKAAHGDTLFVADGQWHHVDFEFGMEDMKAVLFKIYHLQGEFMVTNVSATMAE